MPFKNLLRAGTVSILVGIVLYSSIAAWLSFAQLYPSDHLELGLLLFWFCVSVVGAGVLLFFRAALNLLSLPQALGHKLALFPDVAPRNVLPWRRHRPIPVIAELPNFGLIYGAVLWVLIFLFMIVDAPRHYYGLPIDFRAHDSVVWGNSPWKETLSVYLAVGEKYYINGEPVPREGLRTRLQQELNKRLVWTVYFEADYDTLNTDAVYAMDTIEGLGATLVWITPKVREEWRQKESVERRRR
jgi:biopolymer transport protein ExbD